MMKKILPYIIGIIVLFILGALLINSKTNTPKRMDERITLKQRDQIPYGMAVAKTLLPSIFPRAAVYYDNRSPGDWDSISASSYDQAVILVAKDFNADEDELNRLLSFAQKGNYVFIIAKSFSRDAISFFGFSYNENEFDNYLNISEDSLSAKLDKPVFTNNKLYFYPGKKYESSFYFFDTAHTLVLGRNRDGYPNFIRMKTRNGGIFIHTAPLAFSNYFILHKNNIQYYQNALSVIPDYMNKIVWNEYYLTKPNKKDEEKEPDWFRVLLNYPAFKWGLLTGIFTLILFVLLGARRNQRMIPVRAKPRNDSLDFVRTLGQLYYERRDHHNLAKKMAVYFLEHVRTTYRLSTQDLDEQFIQALHDKSGYPVQELTTIISFINYLEEFPPVSETELSDFYRQLELFYQNT